MSLLGASSLSRTKISPTVGEEGEDEENDEERLSCFKGVRKVDEDAEEELVDKSGTTNGTKFFRVADYPNSVFNEMWFSTVDPFVGIPIFIAKFSERQYCWRVLEDFHSQEYVQFFDVHCGLFMRLHFSIGCDDYRRTSSS